MKKLACLLFVLAASSVQANTEVDEWIKRVGDKEPDVAQAMNDYALMMQHKCKVDVNKDMMMFELRHGKPLPSLIAYIQDRDTVKYRRVLMMLQCPQRT